MNQAKLRQFENFNFENNVVWKEYIKEIDPNVPKERIEKLKKIWYKDNIDPDYDPDFKGNATSSQTQQSTSTQNLQYQQQSTTYKIRYELENFLKVGFILTAVLGISISSKIAFIICVLILYRQEHTPQWSKEYAKKVLSREYGQNIIFLTGFFFIGPFRIFYNLPLIIHFWIGITDYLNIKRGTLYNILQKYVDQTKQKQAYLINLKYQIEIALLPFSIVLWFLGQSSFLTIMFIGNFLRVKYLLNNQFQYQCYYVNTQYLEPHKSKPVIGFIITKIQSISRYLTKVS